MRRFSARKLCSVLVLRVDREVEVVGPIKVLEQRARFIVASTATSMISVEWKKSTAAMLVVFHHASRYLIKIEKHRDTVI
jgi:hypothetical protein